MTQYVKEKVEKIESPIMTWTLLSLIIMLSCVYAYFVNGTIQNIVEAKDLRTKITTLSSSVSNLESEYLSKKAAVSMEYANALGFVGAESSTIYIAKKKEASLSFNR